VLILAVSSTCKQQGSNTVTCTGPAPGINEVVFHTYPSLTALYNAYMAEVMSLSAPSKFKQNYNDCELEQTVARSAGTTSSSTRRPTRSPR
jgi:hypothetical protein